MADNTIDLDDADETVDGQHETQKRYHLLLAPCGVSMDTMEG